MNSAVARILLIVLVAAVGCRQHAPCVGAGDSESSAPYGVAPWEETPAALGILRQRLEEKQVQERLLDDRLEAKQQALTDTAQRLKQLNAAVEKADEKCLWLQGEWQALREGIDQLDRQHATLAVKVAAEQDQLEQLRSTHRREVEDDRLQVERLEASVTAARQALQDLQVAEARDARGHRSLTTVEVASLTNIERPGYNRPDEATVLGRLAPLASGPSRAEIRQRLREQTPESDYRMVEVDSSSRPSAAILRRAMSTGGYRIVELHCEGTGHRVQLRVWADRRSGTMYYRICRVGGDERIEDAANE